MDSSWIEPGLALKRSLDIIYLIFWGAFRCPKLSKE